MEDSERRKVAELIKEMRSESDSKDSQSAVGTSRLNWMYKGPTDLVDREEYLLGKTIDKTFEAMNNVSASDECLGRTGEQSNIPKRLLEKTGSTEQVDIAKKILEDPLYAIKQKELEARKRLLNNPVKLKQIKQMLLERSKNAKARKKQKKKKLKKEKFSSEEVDQLILKYLKKLDDKDKRKALNLITQSDSDYDSSSTESEKERKKIKRKKCNTPSSDTSSSSSSDPSENGYKAKKRKKNKSRVKKTEKKRKRDSNKTKHHNKKGSSSSSTSTSSSSCSESDEDSSSSSDGRKKAKSYREKTSGKKPDVNSKKKKLDGVRGSSDSEDNVRESKRSYGLMMPDGSKPVKSVGSSVKKYEKPTETKAKYVPPPKAKPLSDKEREAKLREMMADAKLRKADREMNLASHRKKEEKEEDGRTYDDDFMRRQMSHLTSQGSVADRIKSNINNIQRSKSSMDSSFMKK